MLFAALAQPLAGAERLVVAPSGQLLSLPFGLLVDAPPPSPRGHEGARSLLVTHCYVDDAAASRVVALALHGLSRSEDFAQALRAAQFDLARSIPEWAHPAFWAAFALVGPRPGHAPVRLLRSRGEPAAEAGASLFAA